MFALAWRAGAGAGRGGALVGRRRARRLETGACCALLALLAARGVRARDAEADHAAAEALFEQGRRLLQQRNYDSACGKFEASQELEPGLGTLLFLGECLEGAGKTASSYRAFERAADLAAARGDDVRRRVATTRAAALRPRLAQLLLRVAPYTQTLHGVEITLNGALVAETELTAPRAIDPGPLVIEVTASGHERWNTRVNVHEGPSQTVVDLPALSSVEAPTPPTVVADAAAEAGGARGGGAASTLRVTALVLGGLGLASLAGGAYFGLRAIEQANESKRPIHCPLEDACRSSGLLLRQQAEQAARRADLGVGVGATLLVSAVTLFLVSPSPRAHQAWLPSVGVDPSAGMTWSWRTEF